jgi:acetyltransferase-like isoleucine patch superfamily enzyme
VLTADRVHISDNEHIFANVSIPVMKQGVTSRGVVAIGEGTWIGENANVLSCKVGRNCVIGANAVVISDIPDFSVAVGVPARVVKRYDPGEKRWTRN